MSLLSAWQISMVAALNQMAHMIIPAVNVRSADVADDAVPRLGCPPGLRAHGDGTCIHDDLPFGCAGWTGVRPCLQARGYARNSM